MTEAMRTRDKVTCWLIEAVVIAFDVIWLGGQGWRIAWEDDEEKIVTAVAYRMAAARLAFPILLAVACWAVALFLFISRTN